ncbi:MAG: hypothetical protein A2Y56_04995 [Candidatus Aminicenantes bacterium RBG_13_63_10]|nr:MAG: hypothetical protein A2Y56_04995 [Candidatus Aminicenantes bacterium RBG_13_63_10]
MLLVFEPGQAVRPSGLEDGVARPAEKAAAAVEPQAVERQAGPARHGRLGRRQFERPEPQALQPLDEEDDIPAESVELAADVEASAHGVEERAADFGRGDRFSRPLLLRRRRRLVRPAPGQAFDRLPVSQEEAAASERVERQGVGPERFVLPRQDDAAQGQEGAGAEVRLERCAGDAVGWEIEGGVPGVEPVVVEAVGDGVRLNAQEPCLPAGGSAGRGQEREGRPREQASRHPELHLGMLNW